MKKIPVLLLVITTNILFSENILISDSKYAGVSKMYAQQIESAIDSAVNTSKYTAVGRDISGVNKENIKKIIRKNKVANTRLLLTTSSSVNGDLLMVNLSIISVEDGTII